MPVKGAGYRGKFGGQGWDGMWTDMSEIVRPTRDGIHGREFISTVVDIGSAPSFLTFDEDGQPYGSQPTGFSLPLPLLFDPPGNDQSDKVAAIVAEAAAEIDSLAVLPFEQVHELGLSSQAVAPVLRPEHARRLRSLPNPPRLVEMDGWERALFAAIKDELPDTVVALRTEYGDERGMQAALEQGVRVFHLVADLHGRGRDGSFVLELIRAAHGHFVDLGMREEVTLIGGGGIVAAEHVAKAILCGLDAVALDSPILVAMQARFEKECVDRKERSFRMPFDLNHDWGVQRLKNLAASWRDQLLEILGAMGLREVRRLRGEMGRAMFMQALEAEAFAGIEGFSGAERG